MRCVDGRKTALAGAPGANRASHLSADVPEVFNLQKAAEKLDVIDGMDRFRALL